MDDRSGQGAAERLGGKMERRGFKRWVRVGLVALAIAAMAALPTMDSVSASKGPKANFSQWCMRC